MELVLVLFLVAITGAIGWVTMLLFRKAPDATEASKPSENGDKPSKAQKKAKENADSKKRDKTIKGSKGKVTGKDKFSHHWLAGSLKGHTGRIVGLDVSPNSKYLATCADDRTIYVWILKNFEDKNVRSFRVNIPFDYVNFVRWSPDSKAFIGTRDLDKTMEVWRLVRKNDGVLSEVSPAQRVFQMRNFGEGDDRKFEYVGLGIASSGKYIMSCSQDGCVELRDTKGTLLHSFLSGQLKVVTAKVSPCGRFIAVAGANEIEMFEVRIEPASGAVLEPGLKWKIPLDKSSKITGFAFNTDSSKLVVVKENGQWSLFDTTGNRVNAETEGSVDTPVEKPSIAITGDTRVVAVGTNNSVYFFSAFTGQQLDRIRDIFKEKINLLEFSADNRYLVTGGDNVIHVFQNVPWYRETIQRLKSQLQDATVTGPLRKRLASELSNFEEVTDKFR